MVTRKYLFPDLIGPCMYSVPVPEVTGMHTSHDENRPVRTTDPVRVNPPGKVPDTFGLTYKRIASTASSPLLRYSSRRSLKVYPAMNTKSGMRLRAPRNL